ncbi:MAG: universal stress protein [Phycisphaerales bacterium]|nr:universal stress protein [Phycisphaerales bacterium]
MDDKPQKILWPTDFSELSQKAGRVAGAIARMFDAELHVIHVIPPPITPDVAAVLPAEAPIMITDPKALDATRDGLKRRVQDTCGDVSQVSIDAFYGNPWSGVCEYAKKHGVDLIVVSTHGRTGLAHVLIGSTAERIVQHASCAVLVVKQSAPG